MSKKKLILITGAAQGIGRSIVTRLVAEGFYIAAVDRDASAGRLLLASVPRSKVKFFEADISRESEVIALFEKVKEERCLFYGLVNNAGIIRDNMIWNMSLEDFERVNDVNLKGTWLMCREASRILKEQRTGRIINIASRAWLGNRGQSNYSASKAGVIGLTRVLALELGKYNVLVNAIAPGLIDTPLTRNLEPNVLQGLINAQPTRTIGKPEDVANAVAFLADEKTSFITGQTLYVDGGKSIGAGM